MLIIYPSIATAPKRDMFLRIRKKAAFAEVQKFLPTSAIWMYAFLFKNFKHFSKHQRQHWITFNAIISTLFLAAFACFSKYMRVYLTIWTTAMISEPKAS